MCHVSPITYNLLPVTWHVSHITCHLLPVTCHLSPTPTSTATDPTPHLGKNKCGPRVSGPKSVSSIVNKSQ